MDWYDVDDILYDGNEDDIKSIRCPICGGNIKYSYHIGTFRRSCVSCGEESIQHDAPLPNCVKFLGNDNTIL